MISIGVVVNFLETSLPYATAFLLLITCFPRTSLPRNRYNVMFGASVEIFFQRWYVHPLLSSRGDRCILNNPRSWPFLRPQMEGVTPFPYLVTVFAGWYIKALSS